MAPNILIITYEILVLIIWFYCMSNTCDINDCSNTYIGSETCRDNMNSLSLVGMQLSEKYKAKFEILLRFSQVVAFLPTKACSGFVVSKTKIFQRLSKIFSAYCQRLFKYL